MLSHSGPVGLDPSEIRELHNWSFIDLYNNNHRRFVDVGKAAYKATCNLINSTTLPTNQQPTQWQCCRQCYAILMKIRLYKDKATGEFKGDDHLCQHAAKLLSRHILDQDWTAISGPCP